MLIEFYVGFPNKQWDTFEADVDDVDPNEGNEALEQVGYVLAEEKFGAGIAFVGVYCVHSNEDEEEFEEE